MRYPGFCGPSYTLDSLNIDAQRCVNLYPKINEMRHGKSAEVVSLIPTPGLRLLTTLGNGPIRGQYVASDNKLYVVSENKIYRLGSDFSASLIGTLSTSSGIVDMDDNGTKLVVTDGPNGYHHTLGSQKLTKFSISDNWLGSKTVSYLDGYFIFFKPDTQVWYITDLLSIDIDALDFASAESHPDNIISIQVNHRELWVFGTNSIEVWYNSGAVDFPFERITGATMEMGCAAAFSVAKINRTTLWLGTNKNGPGVVYAANGYIPQRISTHAVELAIQGYGDVSDATSWTYQENGHEFYVLNFENAKTSWVYDLSSGMWHERAYLKDGNFQRHRANNHTFAYNKHIVGDYENGKLYQLDSSYYTDDGDPLKRLRRAPHIDDNLNNVQYHKFELEIESGLPLYGQSLDNEGQVMLRFSDDGGHNWSNEKLNGIGKIGKKNNRVEWRRLGVSRDRIFEISYTDPSALYLIGAELTLERMDN